MFYQLNNYKDKFIFGASVYPTLYSDVLYIKDDELDLIFNVNNLVSKVCGDNKNVEDNHSECPTKLNALTIGKSAIFQDYDVKIKIDNFWWSFSNSWKYWKWKILYYFFYYTNTI